MTERKFRKIGTALVGLVALVAGYLPLSAEECSKPAEIQTQSRDIKKQGTEKTPEKREKAEEFRAYHAGMYVSREKEPYTPLYKVMFDKNKEVKGKLEKLLGGNLDFKITPKVREVTGRDYFDKCTESELLDSWEIDGENYLLGRYNFGRYDANKVQKADQNLVVISEKGIFLLLPAKQPTDGIVYTAVVGKDGTILAAEIRNQPERMMGNAVAVYTPNKDGEYSAKPNGYIRLPEIYDVSDAVRATSEPGQWRDGLRYIIGNEHRILEPSKNSENGQFSMYRFLPPRARDYKNDK